jgi:hypothetical protein
MPELNFPSGPWTGFYNYRPGGEQHRMDLSLNFTNGRIGGDGSDDIWHFGVSGTFDAQAGDCFWHKTYIGMHTIAYIGFRDGKGIWGTWHGGWLFGGFHIWPVSVGNAESVTETAREPEPGEVKVLCVVERSHA